MRPKPSPLDDGADDGLTFEDVTMLALVAVCCAVLIALVLLGSYCAIHRFEAIAALP